jgi:phage repressor protein C with HTH and peptisase S24 domain
VSADGKPRWPSTESIVKILAVTGMSLTDFFSMAEREGVRPDSMGLVLPLMTLGQNVADGAFDSSGKPAGKSWGKTIFPAFDEGERPHFALKIAGRAFEPLYRPGDVLILSHDAKIQRGDRVLARTKRGELVLCEAQKPGAAGKAVLKPLAGDDGETLGAVSWAARILWVSQ